MRVVERGVLESWLNLEGEGFEHFVGEVCGWGVDDTRAKGKGAIVRIPVNKENEAKGTVVRENVNFDREFYVFVYLVLAWSDAGKEVTC